MGNSEEQGSLESCGPWDHKESDTTEQLNDDNIVALPKREGIYVFVQVIHFAVE